MQVYLIEISDSYPETYWLQYDAEIYPDALLLKKGRKVNAAEFSHACLDADPKASMERLLKYDYLFSVGPDLVSERLARILLSSKEESVQLIPTKIRQKEKLYQGYYIVNYLVAKESFDMEKCEWRPLLDSMPDGPRYFTKMVLSESEVEGSIFRSKENLSEIVVTDDFANKIKNAGIKGIKLIKEKTRF